MRDVVDGMEYGTYHPSTYPTGRQPRRRPRQARLDARGTTHHAIGQVHRTGPDRRGPGGSGGLRAPAGGDRGRDPHRRLCVGPASHPGPTARARRPPGVPDRHAAVAHEPCPSLQSPAPARRVPVSARRLGRGPGPAAPSIAGRGGRAKPRPGGISGADDGGGRASPGRAWTGATVARGAGDHPAEVSARRSPPRQAAPGLGGSACRRYGRVSRRTW